MGKNLVVGQSGGPTAVINSSLAGVIDYALGCDEIDNIYGMINGIEGFLNGNIINIGETFYKKPQRLNRLKMTPAMYLGSCRFKLSSDEQLSNIVDMLEKYNIGYFIYIGGNDSMDTVKKLADYTKARGIDIKVVGVPKTIDNDLAGIDHSPGFGSAAKYVATAVRNVTYDTSIYNIKSVHIIETMGRNAGWLAAASVLARDVNSNSPQLIYLPERAFSVEQFVKDVREQLARRNSVIVVVSEGIKDANGEYICAKADNVDEFGHANLSGTANYLKAVVEKEIGCKVRALELSVLQRSSGHLTSQTDMDEAFNLGLYATRVAVEGQTGVFSALERISNNPYSVRYLTQNIDLVANIEKTVPLEWITEEGNYVTQEMVDYLKPLTAGVPQLPYRSGLPDYIDVSHLDKSTQKYVE